MSFFTLASVYDKINGKAYPQYADMLCRAFSLADIPVREVLDLGCGTGGMAFLLAEKGYDMVALDSSPEMLSLAAEKNVGNGVLLICRDMRDFELYGTVQAVYSSFDCLNYLVSDGDLEKVFSLVHLYLEPGGVFVFDVNTEYRYKNVFDGRSYVYEPGVEVFAVWCSACGGDGLCAFDIDVFEKKKGTKLYARTHERMLQRCYSEGEILSAAKGFSLVERSGGKGFDGCTAPEKSYYILRRDP